MADKPLALPAGEILIVSGPPGSGKTSLLERTAVTLSSPEKMLVIEGDVETERDANRLRKLGIHALQIETHGACHLDAAMTHKGFHRLEKEAGGQTIDLLFIENVGNLVCPSTFDLGEHERVVLVSVPEGPDKPAKYPKAFISSQTFVVSKTDLLPHFDFPVAEAIGDALHLNPHLRTMELSATTGEGMETWLNYLRELVVKMKQEKNQVQ